MMTTKIRSLKKLANLYSQVEQIRSAQLRAASSAVDEVVLATSREAAAKQYQAAHKRAALMIGDREAWVVAAVQSEAAALRQRRLERLRAAREVAKEHAAEAHRISRMRVEQIDTVIDKAATKATVEGARRSQAAADGRFLSRKTWDESQSASRPTMKRS